MQDKQPTQITASEPRPFVSVSRSIASLDLHPTHLYASIYASIRHADIGARVDAGTGARILTILASTLVASPAAAAGSLELLPDFSGPLPVMLLIFVLLIFPLNALIFKPIFSALDARAERIAGARERSKQLQRDADDVLTRYETAIREARAESEAARQQKLETAREEQARLTTEARGAAEAELERARGELEQSFDEARATLRSSAEDLAQAAAERVLGRTLS